MSEHATSRPLTKVADALVGDRLRASVERRVRRELRDEVDGGAGMLAQAMKSPAVRAQIAQEVAAQMRDRADVDFTLSVLLGARTPANRTLSQGRYLRLRDEIVALTDASDAEWRLLQAYRSLLDHEGNGLGRIAGSTYNILGKLVVPPLLDPPAGPVLEIGTLFGLFSPALLRSFGRSGQFRPLTVVDPFTGLQIQNGASLKADPSGTPVTEDVARSNFTAAGLGDDDVRVVCGYSTDEATRAKVADRTYAVIVIDGDHGESGVAADLRWVEQIAAPGAIVVMDDYGDKRWPGVEAATRTYLAEGGRMTLLGTASTSAYLRVGTA